MSPRLPPKISLKHVWVKEMGLEVARQPDGEVVPNEANQIQTQIMIERRSQLFAVISHAQGASQTRFSHDSKNFNVEDETNHDRTGKPTVCRDTSHEQRHEQSMLNEVVIDFRILPDRNSVFSMLTSETIGRLFVETSLKIVEMKHCYIVLDQYIHPHRLLI